MTESNRPDYRELAAARIMIPLSGFATGPEFRYVVTYWGWHMRSEIAGRPPREGAREDDPQPTFFHPLSISRQIARAASLIGSVVFGAAFNASA